MTALALPFISFTRTSVDQLQEAMLALPQVEFETGHLFYAGHYFRPLFRPAGALIVGKKHKGPHLYIVVHGTVRIGHEEVTGPALIQAPAGTKRAVYAVTDALCMNIHETDAKTVEEAEEQLVEPDPTSPYLPGNRLPVKEIT